VNLRRDAISNNEFKRSFLFCYCEGSLRRAYGNPKPFVIASPPEAGVAISTPLSLRGFPKGTVAISSIRVNVNQIFLKERLPRLTENGQARIYGYRFLMNYLPSTSFMDSFPNFHFKNPWIMIWLEKF